MGFGLDLLNLILGYANKIGYASTNFIICGRCLKYLLVFGYNLSSLVLLGRLEAQTWCYKDAKHSYRLAVRTHQFI